MSFPRWSRVTLLILSFLCIWIPFRFLPQNILQSCEYEQNRTTNDLLDKIDLDCSTVVVSNGSSNSVSKLEKWKFDTKPIEELLLKENDVCTVIQQLFFFRSKPVSKEEEDFPLAYGLILHKNIVQVLFMMSSFYHPQNEYCMAVSDSADVVFTVLIRKFADCFPNIHVLERPPISWGSFEIINSTFACFEYLSSLEKEWKYFQYLSGVDIPLKTNREMVEILKVFNGTPNVEMIPFQKGRLNGQNISDSPLKLFKSSLSALVPRETANFIVNSTVTRELLTFLTNTSIADESFWATVMGNVDEFPVPGGLDAQKVIDFRKHFNSKEYEDNDKSSKIKRPYYLSRYQLWDGKRCKGKTVASSCVFGVRDLTSILKKPHLVAHKLYLDFQPAAFFCALKEIRRRSRNPVPFDTKLYSELPLIELSQGVSFENLTHPNWLL